MPIQDQYTQILNLANLDVYLETEPNDDAYFKKLYYKGCNYDISQTNKQFTILTFIHITFNIFIDIIKKILFIFKYIYDRILLLL